MAKSRYEYVREFESSTDHRLLLDSFIVVRIDGQCFHRFSKEHNFLKPNDKRCLDLMNRSALNVMRSFYPNIVMAYGQSDEYSFILRRMTNIFNRRQNKISSLITSAFTAAFTFYWNDYFSDSKNTNLVPIPSNQSSKPISLDQALKYPATFDGRCILYPNETTLMDYLKWRQVDCHINNLYNTTFYALTGEYTKYQALDQSDKFTVQFPYPKPETAQTFSATEATKRLSHTSSADKNEILFTDYGINYNNELQQFRKGTIITLNLDQELLNNFKQSCYIERKFNSKNSIKQQKKIEEQLSNLEINDQDLFQVMNIDIISDHFWMNYGSLLKL